MLFPEANCALYELAKQNRLEATQYFIRCFGDEWTHYYTEALPPWDDVQRVLSAGALDACAMVARSVNGRELCLRWDREYLGCGVLRWESDPPVNEAKDDIFNRLYWESNMTASES